MKSGVKFGALAALGCALFAAGVRGAAPTLTMGSNGLVYAADSLGNTISDFSYVGYKGATAPIPTLPVKKSISPVAGDNTSNIQSAINAVAALPADANGFRGALYLNAGTYPCSGTISWGTSGVVLRGAGNGTIIQATGTSRTLVSVSGSGGASKTGSTVSITDSYMPGGTKTFNVSSTSGFGVGTNVIVSRPSVQSWITDIHMDFTYLGTAEQWNPGTGSLSFERTITAINGTTITVDIPIPNAIETTAYGLTGTMQAFTDSGRIQNCGIENLQLQGAFSDVPTNEISTLGANFDKCKNCWMRNVFVNGFGNGLTFSGNAKFCTITNCDYENPPTDSTTDPPAAYTLAGQLSLCAHCTANGVHYHLVVTQGGTAGPNVFVDCTGLGPGAGRDAGPHQRWASGVLFDRMVLISSDGVSCTIAMENRGNDGSGQGWAQGFSVEWNPQSPSISCQEPSYAVLAPQYNWCIGGIGGKKGAGTNGPWGEFQNFGTLVQPSSLYLEQLRERLGSIALPNIGYARFSGNYKILNRNSGLAVNVNGASTADNASIIQWPFNPSPTNAEWQFIDVGGGRFEIKNVNSGKALAASSTVSNAPIVQTTYSGNGLDQWLITDMAPFAKIVNKATGFALEVPGSSTANGTQLDQAAYGGGANQQFQILTAP